MALQQTSEKEPNIELFIKVSQFFSALLTHCHNYVTSHRKRICMCLRSRCPETQEAGKQIFSSVFVSSPHC